MGSTGYKNLVCKFFESEVHWVEVDLQCAEPGYAGVIQSCAFFFMGGYFIIHQVIFSPLLIQNYHFKKSFCSLAPSPLTTQSLDARTQMHGAGTLPHCVHLPDGVCYSG